jgi:hypothetical protein
MNFKTFVLVSFLASIAATSWCKDLYVATNGSDSTTYAANDIDHPWLTIEYAWGSAQSGDIVFYRAGTYSITTSYDSLGNADNVTHQPYNGETVIWDTNQTLEAIRVGNEYITIDGFIIDGSSLTGSEAGFFRVGYDNPATHFTLKNCTATIGFCSDNCGVVHARSTYANYLKVENNTLTGSGFGGGGISNSSVVWLDALLYAEIINNTISYAPVGIYYKHSNERLVDAGPLIQNNYVYNCSRNGMLLHCNYGRIINNLLVDASISSGQNGGESDPGGAGSDYNEYSHNTLYNTHWSSVCADGSDPGSTHNIVSNNIFYGYPFRPEFENSCSEDMFLSGDYNLFPSGTAVIYRSTNYTLSAWQSVYSTDINSISDEPLFVGAGSPASISDYALTTESPGYQDCADGTDMGADVSLVGVNASSGGIRKTYDAGSSAMTFGGSTPTTFAE